MQENMSARELTVIVVADLEMCVIRTLKKAVEVAIHLRTSTTVRQE